MVSNMNRYMLDTNMVSYFIKGIDGIREKVIAMPMEKLCISAITEGELLYDLAKLPGVIQLQKAVHEFLLRIDVLPWDSSVAERYGTFRAMLQRMGKTLGNLDMLIAAHALSSNSILVTKDRAFAQINDLQIEDWTESR